jgi:hypothetical protein
MKKINYLIAIMVLFTFLQGCYKDKGNYDYKALGTVTIDTTVTGFQSEFALYRYDTLKINPAVHINGTLVSDEKQVADKFDFTWSVFQGTVGSTLSTRDTLAHTMNLNVPITKPEGIWIVLLTVKELSTRVETYLRFNVKVSEALSDGWVVLYERDGKTDAGLIVDDRSKKNIVKFRLFLDLVKSANGVSLDGKPIGLVHSVAPINSGEVLVASERDMVAVDKASFGKVFLFDNLFWTPPAAKSLKALVGNFQRKEMVINNNRVHSVNFSSSGTYRTNKLGPAMNGSYGELENWAASFYGANYDAVVYDKTNKKFMYVPLNGTAVIDYPAQLATAQFNPASVGLDMKASDWGLTNYEYSIMSGTDSTYLLISNFAAALPTGVALRKINMSKPLNPGLATVTTMATASVGQYLLYGSGSNVYLFKYNSGVAAELAWSAPEGDVVTCVRLQKFYYPAFSASLMPLANQVVYIATWNEAAKTGKVYSYTIDPSSGAISKASERVTEGYGKVKDMSYKWSL